MRSLASALVRFLKEDDGPTAVEYAVMLGFIIVVCFTAIQAVGNVTNSKFNNDTLRNSLSSS